MCLAWGESAAQRGSARGDREKRGQKLCPGLWESEVVFCFFFSCPLPSLDHPPAPHPESLLGTPSAPPFLKCAPGKVMKLVRKDIEKDSAGQVTLVPEEPEDMWHTYNLVQVGDSLRASTIRKVQTESSTGSVGSNRVRTTLTLCVEAIDFDSQACQLRVKGTNIQENEYVKMGAYHTIELEPNRQFTLAKKQWDSVVLERIEQACDPAWSADVAAVVMQEGLAHVCLVTPSMTLTRAKVEVNIPRKRKGNCSQHDRALERFYEQVVQAIQRHINFDVVKCVLVASPGFVREQFCDYMFQQAVKTDNKTLLENRSKFLQVKLLPRES